MRLLGTVSALRSPGAFIPWALPHPSGMWEAPTELLSVLIYSLDHRNYLLECPHKYSVADLQQVSTPCRAGGCPPGGAASNGTLLQQQISQRSAPLRFASCHHHSSGAKIMGGVGWGGMGWVGMGWGGLGRGWDGMEWG